jgi:cytochrome c-type biogenesis protein CcmF
VEVHVVPGDLAVKAAAVLAIVAFVAAVRWARGHDASKGTFQIAYHGMTATLGLAVVLLMAAILTHDFRLSYVAGYSSRDLPLIYLVSSFWAGQQGTYLLWAFLGALVGYPLFRKRSWQPAAVMAAYVPTILFMLALMLHPDGNPFKLVAQVPPDGRGLNPLLQDPWMACHPPVIFLGYVAMTVPAVLALTAIFKKEEEPWLGPAIRWALIGFVTLGVGIIMGGFWAYKVLGWGGYWGWDPVENASLLPWLAVTALFHGLLVQKQKGALRVTNLILALGGYILVLYATFLTRSGVLAEVSVHSFAEGSIYWVLLGIIAVALGASLIAIFLRKGPPSEPVNVDLSWPFVLSCAMVLFSVALTFVLVGTSSPIFSRWLPRPDFYNRVNLPVIVTLLALLGMAPFLAWGRLPWKSWGLRVAPSLVLAAAGTAAAVFLGGRGTGALLVFFVALVALASNLIRFVEVMRARWWNTGAAIAHVGFALMFLGIVASSAWETTAQADLPLGRPVEVMDRILTFRGHVDGSEPQDRWNVVVQRPGEPERNTQVTMFRFGAPGNESTLSRPAILREVQGDFYIAPMGLEFGGGGHRQIQLSREQPTRFGEATLTYLGFNAPDGGPDHMADFEAVVLVSVGDEEETITLPIGLSDGRVIGEPVSLKLLPDVRLTFEQMSVEQGWIVVHAEDPNSIPTQVLTAEIRTKPLIGLLWAGTILLTVGCVLAVVRRYRDGRLQHA